MIHGDNSTIHSTRPSDMDKAVENAKSIKLSLNKMFRDELLSRLAVFLDNCNPCWLSEMDGCTIKLKAKFVKSKETATRIITKVIIGDYGFNISPDELIKAAYNKYSMTPRNSFSLSDEDVYVGLTGAYSLLISQIEDGDKIAGLTLKYSWFGRAQLALDLQ